jgi:hypothetical protein
VIRPCTTLLLVLASSVAFAQTWFKVPVVRSCEAFMKCEAGLGKLSATNRQKLEQALKVVSPKVSVAEVSKRLGTEPFETTPPTDLGGGVKVRKAMWSLERPPARQSAEHLDVLFYDDRAVQVRWYEKGVFKQSAEVRFAE